MAKVVQVLRAPKDEKMGQICDLVYVFTDDGRVFCANLTSEPKLSWNEDASLPLGPLPGDQIKIDK